MSEEGEDREESDSSSSGDEKFEEALENLQIGEKPTRTVAVAA